MAIDPGQRLAFLENELSAYRAENDRLAAELTLVRKTIATLPFKDRDSSAAWVASPVRLPRPLWTGDDIIFKIDRCEVGDRLVHLAGWAFCPRIDGGESNLSLLLENGATAFVVKPDPTARPDVAVAHAQVDLGPSLPIGAPGRSRLSRSGFAVLFDRTPLGAAPAFAVAIQIDGPDFSVRKPTGLILHG